MGASAGFGLGFCSVIAQDSKARLAVCQVSLSCPYSGSGDGWAGFVGLCFGCPSPDSSWLVLCSCVLDVDVVDSSLCTTTPPAMAPKSTALATSIAPTMPRRPKTPLTTSLTTTNAGLMATGRAKSLT